MTMLVGAGLALGSGGKAPHEQGRKTTDAPIAPRGKMGQDLFLAIDHRDLAGVQSLLKQGADPNSSNGLEFRPLYIAAASHQLDVMQALLDAGAKADEPSSYGTPLTFACMTGNIEGAKLLLDRGVKVNFLRTDGMTPLMEASNTGAPDVVEELLKHKADIKIKDDGGSTALSLAARQGHIAVLNMLLGAGAAVKDADVDGITPLMEASMNGHADCVSALLKKGAKPNAQDAKGRTALMLAASYGDYPEVISALKKGGATAGKSAGAIAATRGYKQTATALGAKASASTTNRNPRQAVNSSLKLLQSSMLEFNQSTTCVSCHHEGLGRIATGGAHARGFRLDPKLQAPQSGRINGMMGALRPLHEQALRDPQVMKQVPLIEINEVSDADCWLLCGMAANNQPPTAGTAAMAMVLAKQQSKDGNWSFSIPRVPMQSSPFTFTALAVRSLNAYGPKSHGAEMRERIGHAKDWLAHAPVQNSEDRASRLLGLKWAGAAAKDRQAAFEAVRADQRQDGGWAQLPNLHSDAYATGQALYALHVGGGMPVTDPVYKRGVQFLLRTQDADGSWFVNKRAIPANNYFDTGFPHGESQYASFNGTSWATLALLETIETKKRGKG
ncbi:MAG: ankyrin repeat domain-containing protein [Fimbriimonas ginsengisoli]|uniref:Ankyrin repeat domain-containing protein n=1 Tax=Fimbriimonas ginsengisoli TaxID=1005039 RepID=A0A931PUX7_FIMGI|nr:ankyrin repeat domain-containing protein [Fimbriimonas ginsengisoli]MBI3721618.1 ankyrin repeat domain-containing protein [Fimbriimonas ginsengisoli]